jgi:hypothetical protein
MRGRTRDRPPVPGTLPAYAHILVMQDSGKERKAQAGASTSQNGVPVMFVTYTEGRGVPSEWVGRSRVRLAPPTLWQRIKRLFGRGDL